MLCLLKLGLTKRLNIVKCQLHRGFWVVKNILDVSLFFTVLSSDTNKPYSSPFMALCPSLTLTTGIASVKWTLCSLNSKSIQGRRQRREWTLHKNLRLYYLSKWQEAWKVWHWSPWQFFLKWLLFIISSSEFSFCLISVFSIFKNSGC